MNTMQSLGLLGMVIFGLIVIIMILTGNAHYIIAIPEGSQNFYMQSNPFFDFSVLMVFSSLLFVAFGVTTK